MLPQLMHKIAAEMPDQQQFEQEFSNIAFTFLKDRASGLLDYLIGFEIVERPEDGNKAVGVLGFLVGDRPIYVPAFWSNSQLTGMDLLFDRRQDQFYPLTENWVNRVTSMGATSMGNAGATDKTNLRSPRFDENIIRAPNTQKRASAEYASDDFKAAWVDMKHSLATSMATDERLSEDLNNAFASTKSASEKFTTKSASILVDYLENVGGPEAVATTLGQFKSAEFANAALAFYEPADLMIDTFSHKLMPKTAAKKEVTEVQVLTGETKKVTEAEAEKIQRDGFSIRDDRDKTGEGYDVTVQMTYQNPTTNGVFKLRFPNGQTRECFVGAECSNESLVDWQGNIKDTALHKVFIIDDFDSKGPVFKGSKCSPREVFVQASDSAQDQRDGLWDKALDLSTFKAFTYDRRNKKEGGSGIVPSEACSDGSVTVALVNEQGTIKVLTTYASPIIKTLKVDGGVKILEGYSPDNMESMATLVPGLRNGDIREIPGNRGVVTSADHWRLVIINPTNDNPTHTVGLMPELAKVGMHELTVKRSGFDGSYVITDGLGTVVEAGDQCKLAYMLAAAFELPGDFAQDMAKQAHDKGSKTFMYKRSAFLMAPESAGPPPSNWDSDVNAVEQPDYVETIEGSTHANSEPYTGAGSEVNIFKQPMGGGGSPEELAMAAAESGQKQVFDHASIGSLAISYSVTEVIDSYVIDMYKTLDRLGRIIFLIHWEPEDFSERYGTDDMEALKNNIRTVFKGLGDLILKLHQSNEEVSTSAMSIGGE